MKLSFTVLFVFLAFVFTSCEQTQQTQNKNPLKDSPIGVLKTFTDAKNNKDVETMKQTLSKHTLETIDGVAKGSGLTLEEYLRKGNTTPLNKPEMPETRSEKIENEIATVEIKRSNSDAWRKLTFIKEDNLWKMDLVKYLDEIYPNIKEQ
jgi:predicted RND superfamily exporter protein